MAVTVVIPTFNRCEMVLQAVHSALQLKSHVGTEVIVVDDCSADGTVNAIRTKFEAEIRSGDVKLLCNTENVGVTGAKNAGAMKANGKWILFLDSDDLLLTDALAETMCELHNSGGAPVVFFRCLGSDNKLIGRYSSVKRRLGTVDILKYWVWGECLPAVQADAFRRFPYDSDLKGYEGLSYCRMTRALGSAILSTVVSRAYRTTGSDRLSSVGGIRARSCELAKGHWRVLREFAGLLGPVGACIQFLKVCGYGLRCIQLRARAIGQ